jgi:hypothetical protein
MSKDKEANAKRHEGERDVRCRLLSARAAVRNVLEAVHGVVRLALRSALCIGHAGHGVSDLRGVSVHPFYS